MQYPLSAFASVFDSHGEGPQSTFPFPHGDASHLAYRNPNISRLSLAGLIEHAPRHSNLIADRCKQVGELRSTRGKLSEPVWRDCLGVVIYADDGQHFAHEWSKGDDRYTYQETEKKLRDLKARDGATTCAQFQKSNPEGCKGCPSLGRIKSPIVLACGENESEPQPGIRQETHHQDQISQQGQQKQKDNFSSGATLQSTFPLRWHGEENTNINRKWLVKQLLPETGVGLISGQWGTAKTFVAIELSISVLTGNPFAGRSVKRKGGVLFIAAEGASEIPIRVSGLIETKLPDLKGKFPFAWAENCPTLMGQGAIEQLVGIAREAADRMKAEFGVDLVLIVVDTMSAAAGFKDENASSEGQFAMNVLNDLSRRIGALVLACDHFGKAVETGTRGTSAKEASADVIIACLGEKTQAGNVTNLRIAVRKLRGGATGAETAFRLRAIDMGVDEDNDPITTCVIEWSPVTVGPPLEAAKGKGWPKSTTLFRVALVTTLKLHGTDQQAPPGGSTVFAVELDRVREEYHKRYPLDAVDRQKQLNNRRQVFKRSMTTAQSKGLIEGREIDGKFMVWLTRPEDEGVSLPSGSSAQASSVTPA